MFIEKVKNTISRHRMLERGDRVLVAASGGVDSSVLLHALLALRRRLGLKLFVAHVNHNLRGAESRRDLAFVKRLAVSNGLEFAGVTLRKKELKIRGKSLQAVAREKRLRFLTGAARRFKATRIALGHNADDQAETVLMRVLKGSGLDGLCGIQPVRGRFIRPLIDCARDEIERFAASEGVKYVTDSSNLTADYLRNDIRLELMPFLKRRYNPAITATLGRIASILGQDADFMRSIVATALSDAVCERGKDYAALDRLKLGALHPAISKRVFSSVVWGLKKDAKLYSAHSQAYLDMVNAGEPSARYQLPCGLTLRRVYDRIIISGEKAKRIEPFDLPLDVPGATLVEQAGSTFKARVLKKLPCNAFEEGPRVAYFDYGRLAGNVRVRTIKPGDRMTPFGMSGQKKIKEMLIDKKVPAHLRKFVPVVYSGGEIIWLAGIRQSERFKVTDATKKILRLEFSAPAEGKVQK